MVNFFHKYEIKSKYNSYKSVLQSIKKYDYSNVSLDDLKVMFFDDSHKSKRDIIYYFSVINEIINKIYNIKVHDEQILGAIALYNGNITEMKTGEGKSIVALFPAILHSYFDDFVHIVTANDYLAKRDFEYASKVFSFLGLDLGIVLESSSLDDRKNNYSSKVVYSTAKNLCFDYLHDNLVKSRVDQYQKERNIAIIDEIDFILIEEARTPIAISGKSVMSSDIAILLHTNIDKFTLGHEFIIDEKTKNIELTEHGFKALETLLVSNDLIQNLTDLYKYENLKYLQLLYQTLKSNFVLNKDVDYIIKNNEIVIIDESTGRVLEGRRWSEGLHQAVEIKENMPVKPESKTLASSTLQGYFSKYKKLCGMTGTAKTEEIEFKELYNLDIIQIPTHKVMVRNDLEDALYSNKSYAAEALLKDVIEQLKKERPVLIGTTTVKDSEVLYALFSEHNIPCNILNAKNHEKEAHIIENAGKRSSITIATNMAGRGTDIMLGGNKDTEIANYISNGSTYEEAVSIWKKENSYVNEIGGLHVVGFARSPSRRLDNQLIGRSGRQGDNGSSKFYLSLEDELLSVFGKALTLLWNTLTMGVQNVGVIDKRVSKQILEAQKKNEHMNFNIRKNLIKYSEIIEKQSQIITNMRLDILDSNNLDNFINKSFKNATNMILEDFSDYDLIEEDTFSKVKKALKDDLDIDYDFSINIEKISELNETVVNYLISSYQNKKEYFEGSNLSFEKSLILEIIDNIWTEHLTALDNIRKGTAYRRFAQKDPFDEFKNESFKMFKVLINQIYMDVSSSINAFDPIDFINKLNYNDSDKFNTNKNIINYKNVFLGNINRAGF